MSATSMRLRDLGSAPVPADRRRWHAVVIFVHPTHDSLAGAALARYLRGLDGAGASADVIDLYREAVVDAAWSASPAPSPAPSAVPAGASAGPGRAEVQLPVALVSDHRRRLALADELVLVHPTWWSGQPALLKLWFETLWPPLPPSAGALQPTGPGLRLTGVRRITVVTTYGSSRAVNTFQGDGGARTVRRLLRWCCSPVTTVRRVTCYRIDRSDAASRQAFLDRVERAAERPPRPWRLGRSSWLAGRAGAASASVTAR